MALANQAGYATTFAYITNSLRRGWCNSTTHYRKSRHPVDLLEKPRLCRNLRPALLRLAA